MQYGLELVTPPASEPLTAKEIMDHTRVLARADQDLVVSYAKSAREWIEERQDLQFMQATYRMVIRHFPYCIPGFAPNPAWWGSEVRFPRAPLASVELVQYVDTDGNTQTLASTEYQVSRSQLVGVMRPARLKVWPVTDPQTIDAVTITYKAGYASASLVPERAKQAIRMIAAHLYENRQIATEKALKEMPFSVCHFVSSLGTGEWHG